jgi:hypothetical protein
VTVGPAQLLQRLHEGCETGLSFCILRSKVEEYAYATHTVRLLRARRERQCSRRAAEQCDELAPFQ